jgi:hypothetical protein
MSLDEHVLVDVEAARTRLEVLEDQAYEARAAFHQAIRRLHAAGGSMREIATALGMSHQRVHQIIGTEGIVEVEASAVTEVSSLPVAAERSSAPAVATTTAEDACSFCGAPRRELDKLLAGPGPVFICDACARRAAGVVTSEPGEDAGSLRHVPVEEDATCSFCGNSSSVGGAMAEHEGGSPRICAKCTTICERLLRDDKPDRPMMRRNSRIRCSFCNISQADTQRLIAGGRGVHICEGCVGAVRTVVVSAQPAKGPRQVVLRPAMGEDHGCSFCDKRPGTVTSMVKGGRGRICDECLGLCEDIIQEAG